MKGTFHPRSIVSVLASQTAVRCHRSGPSEKGTWVPLFHPPAEGKLIRAFEGLDVGDRVRVQLIGIDVERGFIDFSRAGGRQGG